MGAVSRRTEPQRRDRIPAVTLPGENPRERPVRMIVADSRDRIRDLVLLAELYVLAIRDTCCATLMRQLLRRAKDAISRHIHGVSGHVIDAVHEGNSLQRYVLPQEFTVNVVRRTLHDLIPDAQVRAS